MLWKILKYSFLVLLIASAALAVYGWLDTAVSLDHARQQQKTERERGELLRQFVSTFNYGAKRSEIMQFVNHNLGKGHVVKEETDRILVDDVVFRFDNTESLVNVQFLGQEDEGRPKSPSKARD